MDYLRAKYFRYLPISSSAEDWGVFITTAGHSVVPPDSPYPLVRHPSTYHFSWERGRVIDEYQMIYITHGEGIFETTTCRSEIMPGTMILLFPGVWHRYRPKKKTGWTEYWIGMKGYHLDALLERGIISPDNPVLPARLDANLVNLFNEIFKLIETQPIGYEQISACQALTILATSIANVRENSLGGDRTEEVIQRAKALLAEQAHMDVDMQKLAEDMHISYNHFRRIFRHYTGLPPHQYHIQLRLNRAKEMLRGTDLPIKSIAQALGFDNQYYFSRFFKQRVGKSPERWRNQDMEAQERDF